MSFFSVRASVCDLTLETGGWAMRAVQEKDMGLVSASQLLALQADAGAVQCDSVYPQMNNTMNHMGC